METAKTLLLIPLLIFCFMGVVLREFFEFLFFLLKGIYYLVIYPFILFGKACFSVYCAICDQQLKRLISEKIYEWKWDIKWKTKDRLCEIGIIFGGIGYGILVISVGVGYFILGGVFLEILGVSGETQTSLLVLFMPWWGPGFLLWWLISRPFVGLYKLIRGD